jgi:hypothetical protein
MKTDMRACERSADCAVAAVCNKAHIYRGLRADRRTAFNAEFWRAAAARFDTLRAFTSDVPLETRKTFGALRRRTPGNCDRRLSHISSRGKRLFLRFDIDSNGVRNQRT